MTVATLTPKERHLFKQCRRAWDLQAGGRRNLEPIVSSEPFDVDRCVRDALAVYYYPGMWDWTRSVVIPLVGEALERAMAREAERLGPELPRGFDVRAGAARRLLEHYVEWAPTVERLAPVLVEVDFSADLPDPAGADSVLRTARGQHVRYQGRLDLLGVDEHDAYWITRHRVVREWTPLDALARDEEAVAACWAWEQYYIGMEVTGTIHDEMRLPTGALLVGDADRPPVGEAPRERGGVPQHEASGGGRSIPQHRRLYARSTEPADPARVVHDTAALFRRTWIRRSRSEIIRAGRQLAAEAREIFSPEVVVYPSPSVSACRRCPFAAPCMALYEGRGAEADAILDSSYRSRPRVQSEEGRLGGATWSTGRGAAPPRFGR
ncbi:MAG: hypothetical protein ACLQRH_18910 [Acidimicrobiales bacterium]